MEQNDKIKGFGRLLEDMEEDTFHDELVETRTSLPKMTKRSDLDSLKNRLRKRYNRNQIAPNAIYLPRIALTFAILMTCAVAFLYLKRVKEIQNTPAPKPAINLDSLMKHRGKNK